MMKTAGSVAMLMLISAAGVAAADVAPAATQKLFQWRPFLAPFHSVVLHFPIGFLTMAGILEGYRAFRPSIELRRVTALILWLGLITGIISATFGLMRAGGGDYDPRGSRSASALRRRCARDDCRDARPSVARSS